MSFSKTNKSEELKNALLYKLRKVKSNIETYKNELNFNNINEKIREKYNNCINFYHDRYLKYIDNKETNNSSNKDILDMEYSKIIKIVKNIQTFTQNMENIVINSIDNYNILLSNQLPYYKDLGKKFMIKNVQKLGYNHIFSILSNNQINIIYDKIYDKEKAKSLLSFINRKYPLKININKEDLLISFSLLLSQNQLKQIELNLFNDEEFNSVLALIDTLKKGDSKTEEFFIQNCELQNSDFSLIPFDINHLRIINSKISSSILDKTQFNNLISLVLDNTDLDSISFEQIFKMLFKKNCQICNNLKLLSAKDNYISRIIRNEEIRSLNNKLNALEIFNLANNNISYFNKNIIELVPNLKILDLSNNSLMSENYCRDLIENYPFMVILNQNIGVMECSMKEKYKKYYLEKLSSNEYPIYEINLDCLYGQNNSEVISKDIQTYLSKIRENPKINEISLSSCFINNNSMINILKKILLITPNLSKLNLSNNLLNINFLDLLIENNITFLLSNLTELDLSSNCIDYLKDINVKVENNSFIKFLNNFKQIKRLLLKFTPLEEKFINCIKSEIKKKKNKNYSSKDEKNNIEIKTILQKNCLGINPEFKLVFNKITSKYFNNIDKTEISGAINKYIRFVNIINEKQNLERLNSEKLNYLETL